MISILRPGRQSLERVMICGTLLEGRALSRPCLWAQRTAGTPLKESPDDTAVVPPAHSIVQDTRQAKG